MDLLMKLDSIFLLLLQAWFFNLNFFIITGMVFQFKFFYEIMILCTLNFTIFT